MKKSEKEINSKFVKIIHYWHYCGASEGRTPFKDSRKESILFLFQLVVAVDIPWLVAVSLQSLLSYLFIY